MVVCPCYVAASNNKERGRGGRGGRGVRRKYGFIIHTTWGNGIVNRLIMRFHCPYSAPDINNSLRKAGPEKGKLFINRERNIEPLFVVVVVVEHCVELCGRMCDSGENPVVYWYVVLVEVVVVVAVVATTLMYPVALLLRRTIVTTATITVNFGVMRTRLKIAKIKTPPHTRMVYPTTWWRVISIYVAYENI